MTVRIGSVMRLMLVGALALPMLAACGIRGGLERPDPIFGGGKPAAEETEEAAGKVLSEEEIAALTGPRFNEFGGEVPIAAPTTDVKTEPLDDPIDD